MIRRARRRISSSHRAFVSAALAGWIALVLLCLAGPAAQAQQFPIPGLPGGLGSVLQSPRDDPGTDVQDVPPPTEQADQTPSADPDSSVNGADPTAALIGILRDDAAREALIERLQEAADSNAANGASAPPGTTDPATADGAPATAPANGPAVGTPQEAVAETPPPTFGDRAVAATRHIGGRIFVELESIVLRVQRIPNTFALSIRAFEDGLLQRSLQEIAWLALTLYATLFLLGFATAPLRNWMGRKAIGAGWTRRLLLRSAATLLGLVRIFVSVIVGLIIFIAAFAPELDATGNAVSDTQALFVNAFVTLEGARVVLRMVLSPHAPALRLIALGDRAVASLWRLGVFVIYVLGYGQIFYIPLVSQTVSIFVGRAASAVLSTFVVLALILYVLSHRRGVANWLAPKDEDTALNELIRPLTDRWHWPVLAYLLFLLGTVLTRPGNVLLPLLETTGAVMVLLFVGAVLLSALSVRASQRVRIPRAMRERMPLLEERINQLWPAFLRILRFALGIVLFFVLLDILGIQSLGGLLSSGVAERISSGLFGVLLILAFLSVIWLAMTSWVDYRLNPFVGSTPTPREITLLTLLRNAVTVALIIVGSITSLSQLGMNIAPLLASAGVIGLAISFGAQRMVEDILSGIFIQAENAMNVGDVVDVGGTIGTVEKLTVRSVTLRDLSGVVHVIPFSSAPMISNYNRDFAYHVADLGVAYRENVDDVREAMQTAFDELRADPDHGPNILGDLEWFGLNAFGPSELVMRARIKTLPGMQWGIGRAYNSIVKRIFDERGIEIPFPHQTLYFGEDKSGRAPPLHLAMERRHRKGSASGAAEAKADDLARSAPGTGDDHEKDDGQAHEKRDGHEHERGQVRGTDMPDSGDER